MIAAVENKRIIRRMADLNKNHHYYEFRDGEEYEPASDGTGEETLNAANCGKNI